jgi:hypothetical protein
MIPFPKTKAERLAEGDPRLSIEERYPSVAAYAAKVENEVEALVAKRLMLREDVRPALDRLLRGNASNKIAEATPASFRP